MDQRVPGDAIRVRFIPSSPGTPTMSAALLEEKTRNGILSTLSGDTSRKGNLRTLTVYCLFGINYYSRFDRPSDCRALWNRDNGPISAINGHGGELGDGAQGLQGCDHAHFGWRFLESSGNECLAALNSVSYVVPLSVLKIPFRVFSSSGLHHPLVPDRGHSRSNARSASRPEPAGFGTDRPAPPTKPH